MAISIDRQIQDIETAWAMAQAVMNQAVAQASYDATEQAELSQADVVLRGLLKAKTDAAFKEVEQLLLRALQTVFGDSWTSVKIVCTQKHGRLWGELLLGQGPVEAPPLDAFGGGPASLVAFILRVLVTRRTGLAPVLLLDESFSQVSASALPQLAQFLRLLVDKLGMTILLVTHQPLFIEASTKAYRASYEGGRTVFTEITR